MICQRCGRETEDTPKKGPYQNLNPILDHPGRPLNRFFVKNLLCDLCKLEFKAERKQQMKI